ncbi:MAG: hypothetical protein SA339_04975 [Methanomassiliicoccus sp.]|nr:hypothetical protein [Methanomassiliicoccus sp.]
MESERIFAHIVIASFKPGMRRLANRRAEEIFKQWADGYRGYIIQSSVKDQDTSIYITFWNSEESMEQSVKGVDENILKSLGAESLCSIKVESAEVQDFWLSLEPE